VNCGWCGVVVDETEKRVGRRILCPTCGAWTTVPPPSETDLELAYGGWYRPAVGRFSGAGDALLRKLRGSLARRLNRIAPPGPILDVGAGEGTLLEALRRRGRDAVGIDRRSSCQPVLETDLRDIGGRWAAIVFWHSLEHLPQAGAALDHSASILNPEGVLVIAMPNAASFQARVFRERWFANDFPRHLVHVPSRALLMRLSGLGMKIERVSYVRGGQVVFGWLHGFVGQLSGGRSLYDAIRRAEAREKAMSAAERAKVLLVAMLLLPAALACAALEVGCRRGGTVYVEARRV